MTARDATAPGPLATGDTSAIRAALAAMRARADAVLDPYVPVSPTTALDDLPLLLAVAEAVAGLRATMDSGDGLPWWCRYEGGVGFWCVGCGCAAGSSAVVHATDCYALALDRDLAAIAAGGADGK